MGRNNTDLQNWLKIMGPNHIRYLPATPRRSFISFYDFACCFELVPIEDQDDTPPARDRSCHNMEGRSNTESRTVPYYTNGRCQIKDDQAMRHFLAWDSHPQEKGVGAFRTHAFELKMQRPAFRDEGNL